MIEVRFHGRGGQGAVMACDILASALLKEGKFAQSFPLFGGERRGAPVQAFLRISDIPVMARGQVYEPDHIVVLSSLLMSLIPPPNALGAAGPGNTSSQPLVLQGLKKGGWIIINSNRSPESFNLKEFRVATVDATGIAAKHGLGFPQSRPVNTAILGAFSRITGLVGMEALLKTIAEEVPVQRDQNIAATKEAYECAANTPRVQ